MKYAVILRITDPLVLWFFTMCFFSTSLVAAQTLKDLNHLKGSKTETYYSDGSRVQAETMAKRCDSVRSFYKELIDFEPSVTLLVLSQADWSKYTEFPVYGMPHYKDRSLIVASEENPFWKGFIPPLEQLPADLAQQISTTYISTQNTLSMRAFFDLLAIHELGHAYHLQGGLTMQRKWMGELFANILLHTYIAQREPELLPALTLFPKMVVTSTSKNDLKFTTLKELETNYNLLGQQYPENYGWYQCRWHMAAANIYDKGGPEVLQKLWKALKNQTEPLDDSAFARLLSEEVDQSVANVQTKWDD